MNRIILTVLIFTSTIIYGFSQEMDSIINLMVENKDKVVALEERMLVAESDLSKVTKIKVSGYIQAQYDFYENALSYPNNYFYIRRARIKTTYEATDGIKFVLQPDLVPGNISIKDAYVVLNDKWTKMFYLWAGQFNRTNYEVEYSSSQREVPERSKLIRTLYPGERDFGVKLEFIPKTIPLKVQVALLNGNFGYTYKDSTGVNLNPTNKDWDELKDVMARATYTVKLGQYGGVDFGAHAYFGKVKAISEKVVNSDYSAAGDVKVGGYIDKNWVGAEAQVFLDVLGGMSIKGEYIKGTNVFTGYNNTTKTSKTSTSLKNDTLNLITYDSTSSIKTPAIVREFSGYYIYLIKNIGKKNKFAFRYDYFDPNTKLSGNDIGVTKYEEAILGDKKLGKAIYKQSGTTFTKIETDTRKLTKTTLKSGKDDIAYQTFTFAWHYYFDDNIRLTFAYEMPINEKSARDEKTGYSNVRTTGIVDGVTRVNDYSIVYPQNIFTLRIQAKF